MNGQINDPTTSVPGKKPPHPVWILQVREKSLGPARTELLISSAIQFTLSELLNSVS
jgi:hypothetical protein